MDAFVIRNGKAPAAKPAATTEAAPTAASVAGTKRKHDSDIVVQKHEPDIDRLQKDLAARLVAAIKRTEHTERGRPFTTVEVKMSEADAKALLGPQTDAKLTYSTAASILRWLPSLPSTIKDVTNCVATYCGPGDDGSVYAWAGYESLDVTYLKSSGSLKVKVRTLLVGYGSQDSDAHFDGYLACKNLKELRRWIEEKEWDDDFGDDPYASELKAEMLSK